MSNCLHGLHPFVDLGEPLFTESNSDINMIQLFACLDGDPARIFDFCAGGIVFDDFSRLLLCLKLIHSDEAVQILRVENSFCAQNQDSAAAGYRFVQPERLCFLSF